MVPREWNGSSDQPRRVSSAQFLSQGQAIGAGSRWAYPQDHPNVQRPAMTALNTTLTSADGSDGRSNSEKLVQTTESCKTLN
jgi:hypothetical protein